MRRGWKIYAAHHRIEMPARTASLKCQPTSINQSSARNNNAAAMGPLLWGLTHGYRKQHLAAVLTLRGRKGGRGPRMAPHRCRRCRVDGGSRGKKRETNTESLWLPNCNKCALACQRWNLWCTWDLCTDVNWTSVHQHQRGRHIWRSCMLPSPLTWCLFLFIFAFLSCQHRNLKSRNQKKNSFFF